MVMLLLVRGGCWLCVVLALLFVSCAFCLCTIVCLACDFVLLKLLYFRLLRGCWLLGGLLSSAVFVGVSLVLVEFWLLGGCGIYLAWWLLVC